MSAIEGHPATLITSLREKLAPSVWTDPLLRHSVTLTLAMTVLNVANWLYHVVMSRALGPADYGGLSALLGLLLISTVPLSTIQMGLSALVARAQAGGGEAFRKDTLLRNVRRALLLGVALAGILALLSPWVASVLRLASGAPVVIAGTVLISWAVLPVLRGVDQGLQRFGPLGLSLATEGLIKLGTGVILVASGLGLGGAIGGVSLGALGSIVVTLVVARRWPEPGPHRGGEAQAILLRSVLPYTLAILCFSVLTQADVLLVKALFSPYEAGMYAAASTGGKIILYLTAPLAMVILPEIARRHALSQDGRSVLMRGIFYACLAGGPLVLVYFLAPAAVIRLLFGSPYVEAASLLGILGVGMLAYELALLGVYYRLGVRQPRAFQRIGLLAIVFPILILTFGRSLQTVAVLVAASGILAFAGVMAGLRTVSPSPR